MRYIYIANFLDNPMLEYIYIYHCGESTFNNDADALQQTSQGQLSCVTYVWVLYHLEFVNLSCW